MKELTKNQEKEVLNFFSHCKRMKIENVTISDIRNYFDIRESQTEFSKIEIGEIITEIIELIPYEGMNLKK
jgi:hypothetical protein